MKKTTVVLLVVGALFFSSASYAEISTYICDYPTWSDETGNQTSTNPFILTFIVDSDKGNAYMKGNAGTEDVVLIPGEGKLSFVEVTDSGNVMTTTINSDLKSVHSRNSIILGDLIPSQYYGTCEVM